MKGIDFTLNYSALKMFGRQLYSNPWSALSELVANGFDAIIDKKNVDVYLYINMKDKNKAIIELFDNGIGMSRNDFSSKYVKIGRNRREKKDDKSMGRKGIGKLAALYLSENYIIISKNKDKTTAWEVNVANTKDDETPSLKPKVLDKIFIVCSKTWNAFSSGTLIKLNDVNLNRIGDAAINALQHKLSNYFLFNSRNKKLHICIDTKGEGPKRFYEIKKSIPFGNMTNIYCTDNSVIDIDKKYFKLSYKNLRNEEKIFKMNRTIDNFPESVTNESKKDKEIFKLAGKGLFNGIEKEYKLSGWIGVHASIDLEEALKNDSRYVKNQFYNPNQIRIYVRNKLATENILSKLDLRGTYAHYLEGELSFDVLDDNDFEDIATTNRQDFFTDDRIELLIKLLRGMGRKLLADRQKVADKFNEEKEKENEKIINEDKTSFTQEVYNELKTENISDDVANKITPIIGNKLKGEYLLKSSYKLFISHSSKDRIFTDFISYFLQELGFIYDSNPEKTEIFYTSGGIDIKNLKPLSEIIKNMIIKANTRILFLTSKNFKKNEYCLFEGGATWATRAVGEYDIIALNYNSIPKFLTNNKPEFAFNAEDKNSFILNRQNYTNIVNILNQAINHLNNNRKNNKKSLVEEIPEVKFKDKVKMEAEGKTEQDYMNKKVLKYWEKYVVKEIDKYLADNKKN